MTIDPKRVALLTLVTLVPATALAAVTGADGGVFSSLCGLVCGSCAGC